MSSLLTCGACGDTIQNVEQIYREFGRILRQRRSDASLTQDELANKIGLVRTSITNMELGKQNVSLHLLFQLADALGIQARDLLPVRTPQLMSPNLERQIQKEALEEEEADWVRRVYSKSSS